MQFYDIVTEAAAAKGITEDRIGIEMGHSSSYISAAKYRGSLPKVDNAARILDVCGYALCAVPRGHEPESSMTLDVPERSGK